MYRPVTPHGDARSAVQFGDLITIPGGERFHVFVEEGRYLDFKRFRRDLPPEPRGRAEAWPRQSTASKRDLGKCDLASLRFPDLDRTSTYGS